MINGFVQPSSKEFPVGLQSHGPGSSLFQHLEEVAQAAEILEERIILACHDVGKATQEWQAYSQGGFKSSSPHRHGATGAFLAAAIILLRDAPDAIWWAAVALHVNAAHHSNLSPLNSQDVFTELALIVRDDLARSFFVENISRLLPDVEQSLCIRAWDSLWELGPFPGELWKQFRQHLNNFDAIQRVHCLFTARHLLGRLTFADQISAEKQSGGKQTLTSWKEVFIPVEYRFKPRTPKIYAPAASDKLAMLRTSLRESAIRMASQPERLFYMITAPTGLGKTEAMLSLAEALAHRNERQKIVYAVPQVAIGDQVIEDYLFSADAQIWNHLRQEKMGRHVDNETPDDNKGIIHAGDCVAHPFASSYNVTTFNQVLFALCHPHRRLCARGLAFRNAIIILDEFHKLPYLVQSFFFMLAKEYAAQYNCRFILGSATPVEIPLAASVCANLPDDIIQCLWNTPVVYSRRVYEKAGDLTLDDVLAHMHRIREDNPSNNLLVVLNLVGKGTWQLSQRLGLPLDPWERLQRFQQTTTDAILVLDGTVPPFLRRQYITNCRERMKCGGVTLISTQMIEVGVDLDFDVGLIDWQNIAATIQRGGRVGREGRPDQTPCVVHVFRLICDAKTNKSSADVLRGIFCRTDMRRHFPTFQPAFDALSRQWSQENAFYSAWPEGDIRTERQLLENQKNIEHTELNTANNISITDLFGYNLIGPDWGFSFDMVQFVADLYGTEGFEGTELLLFESRDKWQRLHDCVINRDLTPSARRQVMRDLADHRIVIFDREIVARMFEDFVRLEEPIMETFCLIRESHVI